MIRLIFRGLLVLAVMAAVAAYYGLVLPRLLAYGVAAVVGGVLVWSMIGGGARLHPLAFGGAVIGLWPAGALLAGLIAGHALGLNLNGAEAAAWAWPVPTVAAQFASASKRDRQRDMALLALSAIALYAAGAAYFSGSLGALIGAALGAAAASAVAGSALEIPPTQRRALQAGALVGLAAAAVMGARLAIS